MGDFDPELYLRLLGERALASGQQLVQPRRGHPALPEAAEALATAGVIDPKRADAIVADYRLASMLAEESPLLQHRGMWRRRPARKTADPTPLEPARCYAIGATVALERGRLEPTLLSVDDNGGHLHAVFTSEADLTAGPPALSLRLPSGATARTTFGGGWGDYRAEGSFDFTADLSGELPWLEVEGHRIDLAAPQRSSPATVETLDSASRPMRYLWHMLGDYNGEHNHSRLANRGASDALVAAGLIDPADPELEAALWVADTRAAQPHRMMRRHHPPTPLSPNSIPEAVPEPWRKLLSMAAPGSTRTGVTVLGAVSPVFDGLCVAIDALEHSENATTLEVRMAGPGSTHSLWWACDDLDNWYLGETGSWRGGGDGEVMAGQIVMDPIHPRAVSLTLLVSTLDAQARFPIDLDPPSVA